MGTLSCLQEIDLKGNNFSNWFPESSLLLSFWTLGSRSLQKLNGDTLKLPGYKVLQAQVAQIEEEIERYEPLSRLLTKICLKLALSCQDRRLFTEAACGCLSFDQIFVERREAESLLPAFARFAVKVRLFAQHSKRPLWQSVFAACMHAWHSAPFRCRQRSTRTRGRSLWRGCKSRSREFSRPETKTRWNSAPRSTTFAREYGLFNPCAEPPSIRCV